MRAVNLIPSDGARAAGNGGRSDGAAYAVLGLIAGLALLALLYGIAHHQISSRRAEAATLAARAQRAQAAASQLSPYTSFMALREQRMQAVSQLVDSRFDWAHTMHELGRVLPQDASITTLSGAIGSATSATTTTTPATPATSGTAATSAVSSATPPGSVPVLTISGCATSQSEVALTLQRLRLIDGVSDVSLQSSASANSAGANGGGGGSGDEACGPNKPTFTAQLTFDPLPAAGSEAGAAKKITTSTGVGQ